MGPTDFGSEHEALRYFRALTAPEREEHLWMGMRELAALGHGMITRQDHTNGTVDTTKRELDAHLADHRREAIELGFVKRWGGRGTGFLGLLIVVATFVLSADGRILEWIGR